MGPKVYKPELGNEQPAVNEADLPVVLKLSIPQELYAEYETAASKQGLTVTELMMHRLRRCKDHNGLRTLFFTDSQRGLLEQLLQKRPLESAEQALSLLTACMSVRIGEFAPIPLTAQQVKRLEMSAYGGKSVHERLAGIVQGAVSKAVGI